MIEETILTEFVAKLLESQIDIEPEFVEIVNNNFWDLLL